MATQDKKTGPKTGGRGRTSRVGEPGQVEDLPLGGSSGAAGERHDDAEARGAGEGPEPKDVGGTDLTGPGGPPGESQGEGGKLSRGGLGDRGDESRGGHRGESVERRPEERGRPDNRAEAPDVGAAGQPTGGGREAGRAPEPATDRPGLGEDNFAGEGSVEGYPGFFGMRLRPK